MDLAIFLAVVACCIGGGLGGFALARPEELIAMVGLKTDTDKAHSLAEVRATYGGLFLLSHGATAGALGYAPSVGAAMALTLALAWVGAALGRGYSMVKEGGDTRANARAAIFALLMGVTLALPFWSLIDAAPEGAVLV